MLYILASFTPWITYWILCGMGYRLGVLAPLIITLQIRKKDFNLMDVTSLLYSTLATTGMFTLNLHVFVEESDYLGYLALAIMALFSLAVKQPLTLQAARRDYPEVYWRDKTFLTVNNIVTGAWAVI